MVLNLEMVLHPCHGIPLLRTDTPSLWNGLSEKKLGRWSLSKKWLDPLYVQLLPLETENAICKIITITRTMKESWGSVHRNKGKKKSYCITHWCAQFVLKHLKIELPVYFSPRFFHVETITSPWGGTLTSDWQVLTRQNTNNARARKMPPKLRQQNIHITFLHILTY